MNRIYIEPTKFTNLRGGEEYFGWRAYDDYAQAYDNTWDKADIPDDDVTFLKRVLKMNDDETLWSMLDFCAEHERGIHVGNTFVDWPELSLLLEATPLCLCGSAGPGGLKIADFLLQSAKWG